jgi:hypothetical protein
MFNPVTFGERFGRGNGLGDTTGDAPKLMYWNGDILGIVADCSCMFDLVNAKTDGPLYLCYQQHNVLAVSHITCPNSSLPVPFRKKV